MGKFSERTFTTEGLEIMCSRDKLCFSVIVVDDTGSLKNNMNDYRKLQNNLATFYKNLMEDEYRGIMYIAIVKFGADCEQLEFKRLIDMTQDDFSSKCEQGVTSLNYSIHVAVDEAIKFYNYSKNVLHYDTSGAVYIFTDGGDNNRNVNYYEKAQKTVKVAENNGLDVILYPYGSAFDEKEIMTKLKGLGCKIVGLDEASFEKLGAELANDTHRRSAHLMSEKAIAESTSVSSKSSEFFSNIPTSTTGTVNVKFTNIGNFFKGRNK